MAAAMTLEELAGLPDEVLTCAQVAPLLKMSGNALHGIAVDRPDLLQFPAVYGPNNRVFFPKRPFLAFMRGEQ